MEVNSSPGLEGIEKTSEIDVADNIIQFLEKKNDIILTEGKPADRNKY